MSFIINYLDKWDKDTSSKIATMKTNVVMEYSLWVPMRAFSIYGFPFIVAFGCSIFPIAQMEIEKIKIEELEENERTQWYVSFIIIHYVFESFILYLALKMISVIVHRPLPPNPTGQMDGDKPAKGTR